MVLNFRFAFSLRWPHSGLREDLGGAGRNWDLLGGPGRLGGQHEEETNLRVRIPRAFIRTQGSEAESLRRALKTAKQGPNPLDNY